MVIGLLTTRLLTVNAKFAYAAISSGHFFRMNDYFQRRNVMRLLGSIPDILRSAPRHRRRRGIRKFLPVVLLLAAGAAFSVLIVYSFLPDDAQTWVLRIQAKIKELAP